MKTAEVLRSAARGLLANTMRSVLTMLGVLIGVGSVILLIAVGNGSSKAIEASIEQLGTNTLTVTSAKGNTATPTRDQSLTLHVASTLANPAFAPDVRSVTPEVTAGVTAAYGDTSYDTQVVGTYPSYFAATNSPVAVGQEFTTAQQKTAAKVAVLGSTVASELFGGANPLGRQVTVNGEPLTIIGIMQAKGSSGLSDAGDTIVAPLSTVRAYGAGYGDLDQIVVQATSTGTVDYAEAEITQLLNQHFGATSTDKAPYRILNQAQLQQTRAEATNTFTVLLAAIAGISLLVGGIGITNIMLVTVTERTREIGIRKALGAPRKAILGQFLAEATMVSLAGGILGVIVGIVGSQFTIAGVKPVPVPLSIVLALVVSIVIGVFFGGYPANRAAKLRPIDALRYD